MSNYFIIGADGRQYGPASENQIRQWAAEGRANGSTQVQPEGGQWAPLATYPQFAPAIQQVPPVAHGYPVYPPGYQPPKSRLAAGLLGVFLGGLGIHRFYLGYTGVGIAQIIVTFVTCGLGCIWGFIEGICILAGSINTDSDGRPLGQ